MGGGPDGTGPIDEPASGSTRAIDGFIEATKHLSAGDFSVAVPATTNARLELLGASLRALAVTLAKRQRELETIKRLTSHISAGFMLDEILDSLFVDFREVIPYDRIGFALLEDDGRMLRARWARTVLPEVHLHRGYAAPMAGSSLQDIIASGRPRIINDLVEYLRLKPESASTRLVVREGIRSSLTCPLVASGVPVGFIFFSSATPHAYRSEHVETFQLIAEQLSVIVEKGHLVSQLADQKAEVDAQNAELLRLSALKDNLLGMVAHDLRNPTAIIQMMVNILRSPTFNRSAEERQKLLDDIAQQTDYMLALLNDLLDVSEIESGAVRVSPEDVALVPMLEATQARHQLLAEHKGITVELLPLAEGTVHADPLRLVQVLDNLISNAAKFSPRNSRITLSAVREGPMWKISVKDQGPGLSAEDRGKLFQNFARLSARPTGGERSTGLGLAITRQVVLAQGGEIGVDSVPGQGATFWFTLPAVEQA